MFNWESLSSSESVLLDVYDEVNLTVNKLNSLFILFIPEINSRRGFVIYVVKI